MEKRALLAFLLSVVILLIWDFYFTPQNQQVKPPAQDSQSVRKDKSTPSQKQAVPPPSVNIEPKELPRLRLDKAATAFKKWTVDSPLYVAEILQPGARLFSFKLKKHRESADKSSPPMELITAYPFGYLPCAVELINSEYLNLSVVPYSGPSVTRAVIGDGSERLSWSFEKTIPDVVYVRKKFDWQSNSYVVDLGVELKNLSTRPLEDRLGLSFYFLPYLKHEPSFNRSRLVYFAERERHTVSLKNLRKEAFVLKTPVSWLGYENNYFIQAIVPMSEEAYSFVARMLNPQENLLQVVYLSSAFKLRPGEDRLWKFRLYLGPKEVKELKKAGHSLVASISYGWVSFLAKPLLKGLVWLYRYTHNYGIAIIILTMVIKLLFWPLTHKSYQSMQKMKKIQPMVAQLREKYKDDREQLNQELLALYRTYKVNPMGGCLPIILQIPFFFALYRMLYSSVELRHQPFCLWINDLTAPDRLYVGVYIPYLEGIPVLTILMGISMFVQQKMTPSMGDPRQDKLMLLMPVVFTIFFVNFPSGLVLYWFVNNLLSIVQQYWINRTVK